MPTNEPETNEPEVPGHVASTERLGLIRLAMDAFFRHEGRDMIPTAPLPWVLAAMADAVAAERKRLAHNVADLHMAQSVNNQNYPSAWHDGVDAALEVIREA